MEGLFGILFFGSIVPLVVGVGLLMLVPLIRRLYAAAIKRGFTVQVLVQSLHLRSIE
jgi:hypothetical protein